MTKPANLESIEKATGKAWQEWVAYLDDQAASAKTHKEIAALARQFMDESVASADWWSQAVAVAYEQHIGRRTPGQSNDGTFELSVTKTVAGERNQVFESLLATLNAMFEIDEEAVTDPRTSLTPVRSYWRASLPRGDKVTVAVEGRGAGKCVIVAAHENVPTQLAADSTRSFWKHVLSNL